MGLCDAELVGLLDAMAQVPCAGSVDLRSHCLQTAWLARRAGADDSLVLIAALHDVGHVPSVGRVHPQLSHELAGAAFAAAHLGARAAAVIALHVTAKRFLATTDQTYRDGLTEQALAAVFSSGGPMNPSELAWFGNHPARRDALRLRAWDDAARAPLGPTLEPAALLTIHASARRAAAAG